MSIPLSTSDETVKDPAGHAHRITVLTDPAGEALHRKSAYQLKVDGKHVAWASDEAQLRAVLMRTRHAIEAGTAGKDIRA